MKHKLPKQKSNKKKNKGNSKDKKAPPAKVPTIEELIDAGDTASASMEADKAFAFYASAEQLLQQQNSNSNERRDQLIYVLEKLGEGRVAMGDLEAARSDFEKAIELLMSQKTAEEKNTPQYHETLAGLYLYKGQLCSELEALEVYKKGLQTLEVCVELRQKAVSGSGETPVDGGADGSMDVDVDSQKEAQAALYQAR